MNSHLAMATALMEDMEEPLHPDLEDYVRDDIGNLGPVLHHPLVVMLNVLPGAANRQYMRKLQLFGEPHYQDHSNRIRLYERPYRLVVMTEWFEDGIIEDEELRQVLRFVWPDMEGDDTVTDPLIQRVVTAFRAAGFISDNSDETAPTEPLTVFRGGEPNGIAWSTDYGVAKWFANRYRIERHMEPEPIHRATAPTEAQSWRGSMDGTRLRSCVNRIY